MYSVLRHIDDIIGRYALQTLPSKIFKHYERFVTVCHDAYLLNKRMYIGERNFREDFKVVQFLVHLKKILIS